MLLGVEVEDETKPKTIEEREIVGKGVKQTQNLAAAGLFFPDGS